MVILLITKSVTASQASVNATPLTRQEQTKLHITLTHTTEHTFETTLIGYLLLTDNIVHGSSLPPQLSIRNDVRIVASFSSFFISLQFICGLDCRPRVSKHHCPGAA